MHSQYSTKIILSTAICIFVTLMNLHAQVQFKSAEFEIGVRIQLGFDDSDPITTSALDTIQHLDLSGYNIQDVDDVIHFPQIRTLDLSHNQITNLTPLLSLPHLDFLNLSYNNLTDIGGFSYSDKRHVQVIIHKNHIEDFDNLSSATFSSVSAIGHEDQIFPEGQFFVNDLFTTTRNNGQAKIYYDVWDDSLQCQFFEMNTGDGNTQNNLICNGFTNSMNHDYSSAGLKMITVERGVASKQTHFIAPYNIFIIPDWQDFLELNLPSSVEFISLINTSSASIAQIDSNQIFYESLSLDVDTIKVNYKFMDSERIEQFYIFIETQSTLPVNLIYLNYLCQKDSVLLSWGTASEFNASHYEIETSTDGYIWVNQKNNDAKGTTSQQSHYSAYLPKLDRLSYARLKQVDLDGEIEIFGPIALNCENSEISVNAFPNPTQGTLKIQAQNTTINSLRVLDLNGKIVLTQSNLNQATCELDLYPFENGFYIVEVQTEYGVERVRVVKND